MLELSQNMRFQECLPVLVAIRVRARFGILKGLFFRLIIVPQSK